MVDARSVPAVPGAKMTWAVLCSGTSGASHSEYVEGTDLDQDPTTGALRIYDGGRLVREYVAGGWSNFCEWVCSYNDFFGGTVVRLSPSDDAVDLNRADAQRALATAMAMDTTSAMALLSGALPRHRRSSNSPGAVRAPARRPGPLQA